MGAVLGLLASDGVDEYMSCQDTYSANVDIGEHESHPRTYRLRGLPTDLLRSNEGTAAGRTAQMLLEHSASKLGFDLDVSPPSVCCIQLGLSSIIEQIHQGVQSQSYKVPKDVRSICWCISHGFPVAVCVPVTIDVMEKRFDLPPTDEAAFAMMPIVLWGYSTVTRKFAAYVPIASYDDGIVVPFDHVLHRDSCDLYVTDIQNVESPDAAHTLSFSSGREEEEEEEEEYGAYDEHDEHAEDDAIEADHAHKALFLE